MGKIILDKTGVATLLKGLGVDIIDAANERDDIETWKEWYCGFLPDFHKYKVFNGITEVERKRSSLQMAKRICEDWANLLLNEKVTISAENENADKALKKILRANRFYFMANRQIEISFALGTGAFVESIRDGKVRIDYVRAEYIYPITCEAGTITECAFANEIISGKEKKYYIQIHQKENSGYKITNALFDENGERLELNDCDEEFRSKVPLFQIITPNKINAKRTDSPFGASIFSDATDTLRGVDLIYDSFLNEFELGKKRIAVPMSMAKKQMTNEGKMIPVFDTNDVAFYAIEGEEENGIKEIDMKLRVDEHIRGLESVVSVLSDKCGLGSGRYSVRAKNNSVALKTATEVISDKSELWQNIRKHENLLEQNLIELANACLFLEGLQESEITVSFDDSIIEDKTAEFSERMQMVSVNAQAPWELRAWYTGEGLEEAKKNCAEITEGYGE